MQHHLSICLILPLFAILTSDIRENSIHLIIFISFNSIESGFLCCSLKVMLIFCDNRIIEQMILLHEKTSNMGKHCRAHNKRKERMPYTTDWNLSLGYSLCEYDLMANFMWVLCYGLLFKIPRPFFSVCIHTRSQVKSVGCRERLQTSTLSICPSILCRRWRRG